MKSERSFSLHVHTVGISRSPGVLLKKGCVNERESIWQVKNNIKCRVRDESTARWDLTKLIHELCVAPQWIHTTALLVSGTGLIGELFLLAQAVSWWRVLFLPPMFEKETVYHKLGKSFFVHHFKFVFASPDLAETQPAMCYAWVTTTLRSRMTLNAPCPLNASSYTESTTVRAGNTILPWCGSKAQRATVCHSTLTLVQCAYQRQETSGRRGLLPAWSLAGASQVNLLLGASHL